MSSDIRRRGKSSSVSGEPSSTSQNAGSTNDDSLVGGGLTMPIFLLASLAMIYFLSSSMTQGNELGAPVATYQYLKKRSQAVFGGTMGGGEVEGHGDFDDGRKRTVPRAFVDPKSEGLYWTNVMLGNDGPEPDLSGGMIPAVAPPFGMTRWTPQTRQHYVSMCPYNQTDTRIHGFLGTHQPAVWMGESGPSQISVGLGDVVTDFEDRGLLFSHSDEYASANYYSNVLHSPRGEIHTEMSATSRVGHLRFNFKPKGQAEEAVPHVVIQASRESVLLSGWNTGSRRPDNVSYPEGQITIDPVHQEVYGWNNERQDHILLSDEIPAASFKGYFVARFSQPFAGHGISYDGELSPAVSTGEGKVLAGYVTFPEHTKTVEVRVGVSFISVEQARRNLDVEIPDGQTLEVTSRKTRQAWAEKLDELSVTGASGHNKTVLYTSYAHTLVYPYEVHEPTATGPAYYSGYLDAVVPGESYSGYSIWDTFRATTAWQILTCPERVPGMITSMLQDYEQGGWLPMWKNIVETNIMISTHADSIIAQAMNTGVKGFNWIKAWEAVRKNAFNPPDRDTELRFEDRQEHTPQEVRAGLTEYMKLGYVASDLHSESSSRTLDYAYDDYAAAIVADHMGAKEDAASLRKRSGSWRTLWNADSGFMEARRSDGSWAGEYEGWTEGDHWAYSLEVLHDTPGLIEIMGGSKSFIEFMGRHFEGGHNLHTNEPSHHIPYLYMYAGAPHKTQEKVSELGQSEYNHTALGLSGNEDCGQMSAWYIFSAMGFYPVDPASATYIIGTPFFDSLSLRIPGATRPLSVTAKGASSGKRYIKSVTIDGKDHEGVSITHDEIKGGADIVFEMADSPQAWGR